MTSPLDKLEAAIAQGNRRITEPYWLAKFAPEILAVLRAAEKLPDYRNTAYSTGLWTRFEEALAAVNAAIEKEIS